MNEEEIKEIIKDFLELREIHSSDSTRKSYLSIYQEALQGLLDLYNKEKLNSLNLSEQLNKEKEKNKNVRDRIEYYLLNNMKIENNPTELQIELEKLMKMLEE